MCPASQARSVGIIVVAESEGIEGTVHTLKRYINEVFKVSENRVLELTDYAFKLGAAKNNPELVEQARKFGKKMVESLTGK